MKRPPEDLARMMERFESMIRSAGVKRTPQRLEIYRRTAETGDHPDIETIHRNVLKKMPGVSLDTVYRTLDLFRELGLVSNVRTLSGHPRFDANTAPHHHFVCTRCGLTRDFVDPGLDALEIPAAARGLGQIKSAHLEVRGLCRSCAAAGRSARKMKSSIAKKRPPRDGREMNNP